MRIQRDLYMYSLNLLINASFSREICSVKCNSLSSFRIFARSIFFESLDSLEDSYRSFLSHFGYYNAIFLT